METREVRERSITFEEVVPELTEPITVNLRDAKVDLLKVSQGADSDLFFAFFNRHLNGKQLYDFFRKVGSDRFNPGLQDVAFDLKFIFTDNSSARRLRQIHESDPDLRVSWKIFVSYYKDLLDMLFESALIYERSRTITPSKHFFTEHSARRYALGFKRPSSDQGHSRNLLKKELLSAFGYHFEQISEKQDSNEKPASNRNTRKKDRKKRRSEIKTRQNKVFGSILEQIRTFRKDGTCDEAFRDRLEEFTNGRMNTLFDVHEVRLSDSDRKVRVFTIKNSEEGDVLEDYYFAKPVSHFEREGALYGLSLVGDKFEYKLIKILHPLASTGLPTVQPALMWTRNNVEGQRSLVTNSKDLETILSELNLDPRILDTLRSGCLLAGLGVIPYVTPDIRNAWDPEVKLKNARYPQFMGPLQRTVWVIKEHEALAQAQLLEDFEKLID